jgi:pyridoxamine 5'-phosphate oxidase
MTPQDHKQAAIELMTKAEIAYVTTFGTDGYPHARAVFNMRNTHLFPNQVKLFTSAGDEMMTYFSTNTSSRKMREIAANPRISVYYCDHARFHGVMIAGEIEIVSDSGIKKALWNDGWERYYPEGPDDPDYTVLRLRPEFVEGWHASSKFHITLKDR